MDRLLPEKKLKAKFEAKNNMNFMELGMLFIFFDILLKQRGYLLVLKIIEQPN
jgi:hypothetical protein